MLWSLQKCMIYSLNEMTFMHTKCKATWNHQAPSTQSYLEPVDMRFGKASDFTCQGHVLIHSAVHILRSGGKVGRNYRIKAQHDCEYGKWETFALQVCRPTDCLIILYCLATYYVILIHIYILHVLLIINNHNNQNIMTIYMLYRFLLVECFSDNLRLMNGH